MSCALPPPSGNGVGLLTRLRHTPLRDLLRGRLTGRLDWERALEVSGLPPAAQVRVALTVRSTKLWRLEKAQVCDELIAHFADGLEAGESAEELARNFGDPKRTAKLIRSAKKKLRPLWWHGWKWTLRGIGALVVVYAGLTLWYANDKVTIKVDYLAQLNAVALATPESERAWPIYREGMLGWRELREEEKWDEETKKPMNLSAAFHCVRRRFDPEEDPSLRTAAWTIIDSAIATHPEQMALFRKAASKPHMGFVAHFGVVKEDTVLFNDPSNFIRESPQTYQLGTFSPTNSGLPLLFGVLMIHTQWMNSGVLQPLQAHLEISAKTNQSDILIANTHALWRIAGQLKEGATLIEQLHGLGWISQTDQTLGRLIVDPQSTSFDAHTLERLATLAREVPISPVTYAGEKLFAQDILQRYYTDNGHDNGHLTTGGFNALDLLSPSARTLSWPERITLAALAAPLGALTASRQEEQQWIDAHFSALEARAQTPPHASPTLPPLAVGLEHLDDPIWRLRHPFLGILVPVFEVAHFSHARTQATHSALQLGIALHRHKLAHGAFPASLDALVPTYLKELPVDPITGGLLHYRLDARGQPIIWSVGADRVDDGGLAPVNRNGEADNRKAQNWYTPEEAKAAQRGDWILWPMSDLPVMPEK